MPEVRHPEPLIIRNPPDAERAARDWMIFFGYGDARMTVVGPDEGVDVSSRGAVAQVKSGMSPTGRPIVQQIYGIAELEGKEPFLFTVGGVTQEAQEWADRAGVNLFQLDLSGRVRPLNDHAREVMANAEGTLSGWNAVLAELETRMAAGEDASITARFAAPGGLHGFWGIWVRRDGSVAVTRDIAGASWLRVATVAEAVERVSATLDELGATYWDARPVLTVGDQTRPFRPRLSYPARPQHVEPSPPARAPAPPVPVRVTASDLYALLAGPGCDRRIFLQANGVAGADPSALQVMLMELGMELEERHRADIPDRLDLSDGTIPERTAATMEAVAIGERPVYQGVLAARHVWDGRPVSLIGVPDFLIPAGAGHVIRDTKTARRVDPDDRPDIAAQLRFYGMLYESAVGRPPARLEVVAGDGEIHEIPYEGAGPVIELIDRVAALKTATVEPGCDVKWSFRTSCPYFEQCWSRAVDARQLSTVPGISRAAVRALRADGIETIPELLDRHDEDSLSRVVVTAGTRRRKVGRRADDILRAARALLTGETIVHGRLDLPAGSNVVLFDLEGSPALGGEPGYIYLWGTAVHGSQPFPYQAVFALDDDGLDDREGWDLFLQRARTIFDVYGDIPWIHWASYEATQVRGYLERYGDRDGTGRRVLASLVDLLPIVRGEVTLPIHSYSLKAVEEFVGYERSQDEFGGDWSIAIWQEAIEAVTTAERRRTLLEQLAVYNREDLEGMSAVYEYLRRL